METQKTVITKQGKRKHAAIMRFQVFFPFSPVISGGFVASPI